MKDVGREEFRVLRCVAEFGPKSVREIVSLLCTEKEMARTTVLTVLERLRAKKLVLREKRDGVYQYSSKQGKKELLAGFVGDFVDNFLGGSPEPFVSYLGSQSTLSEGELRQLEALVEKAKAGRS